MHVVLVHPEIHWNTGNAGRTCLAAGATLHLIEPLGFSLDERQVKRAGLDYWEHVDLHVWPGWSQFEQQLPSLGEPYCRGAIVTAAAEKARRWKEEWTPFYASGANGTDVMLIRLTPIRLEIVSVERGFAGDPKTWRPLTIDFPAAPGAQ